MAENAPAVFNVHVQSFIEIIWAGLRDAKVIVREASVAALRVSLPFLLALLVTSHSKARLPFDLAPDTSQFLVKGEAALWLVPNAFPFVPLLSVLC